MLGRKEIMMQRMMAVSVVVFLTIGSACLVGEAQQATPKGGTPSTEKAAGQRFTNPANGALALYEAARRGDEKNLLVILGPDAEEIIAWSENIDDRQQEQAEFAQKYEQMHRLVKEPDDTVALYVGAENWPFPIPLVQHDGGWYFDTDLGRQEIRYRRLGENEMEALEVCRTLVDAEHEYHEKMHRYTAKFISSDDSRDGLYWETANNAGKSPIGPYLALAGMSTPDSSHLQPFQGYYYRILPRGSDGFAILAFPAEYGWSGVMTFLVNQDGTAYEKDFGSQTDSSSARVMSTQPDSSWEQVE
jgi:Protein of unknown function (DUF2950)